jgi:hypothetical protein
MERKKISFKLIAWLFLAGLIILNLIGLKLYENEIDDYLTENINQEDITLDSLSRFTPEEVNQRFDHELAKSINDYFTSKQAREDNLDELQLELDAAFKRREETYEAYRCECDGTCGNGKTGRGSECDRKQQKYVQADRIYQEVKTQFDLLQSNDEMSILKEKIQRDLQNFAENTISSSYLERNKALWYVLF